MNSKLSMMTPILTLKRLMQEDCHGFKPSLGYKMRSSSKKMGARAGARKRVGGSVVSPIVRLLFLLLWSEWLDLFTALPAHDLVVHCIHTKGEDIYSESHSLIWVVSFGRERYLSMSNRNCRVILPVFSFKIRDMFLNIRKLKPSLLCWLFSSVLPLLETFAMWCILILKGLVV